MTSTDCSLNRPGVSGREAVHRRRPGDAARAAVLGELADRGHALLRLHRRRRNGQCGSPGDQPGAVPRGWWSGASCPPGRRVARKRLIYLGDPLTAAEAHDWGLIDEVAPAGQAVCRAVDLAQRLAAKPREALAAAKQAVAHAYAEWAADAASRSLPAFQDIVDSEDEREGMNVFLAKRTPNFT